MSDSRWKKIAAMDLSVLVVLGVVAGLVVGLAGGCGSKGTFNNDNWDEVCSNTSGHVGAKVDGLVGQVFVAPKKAKGGVAIQMWADPFNLDQSTMVYYSGSDGKQFAYGDIIEVTGTVGEAFTGKNKKGATVVTPAVDATEIAKTDATVYIKDGTTVPVDQQQEQNGVVIAVEKVVLRDNETDVFVSLENRQQDSGALLRSTGTKLQVGGQQFDVDLHKSSVYEAAYFGTMPAGEKASGVLVFPAIGDPVPDKGSATLSIDGSSSNWRLDFEPYLFSIDW